MINTREREREEKVDTASRPEAKISSLMKKDSGIIITVYI